MEDDDLGFIQWTDDTLTWARWRLQQIDLRVRRTLRERPLLSLFGAAAFGCLAGRILSRR